MNNEDKLFDLMTKMYAEMQEGFKRLENEITEVRNNLNEFRSETHERFDILDDKLNDLEANNADRHVYINKELKNIKAGLNKVEIITADNWGEIARIKSTRSHKTR